MTLRVVCARCDNVTKVAASAICRAFSDWTIDELQRAGALGCATCRTPASLAVIGELWARPHDVETWPADGPAWVAAMSDGMSG